jgi:hypothetical protein
MTSIPSPRANAIVRGLLITNHARIRHMTMGGFAWLISTEIGPGGAPHYWVAYDGSRIIRSFPDHTDETLPTEFVDAMAAAGDSPEGRTVELAPGRMPTPREDPSLYDSFDYSYRPPGYTTGIAIPPRIQRLIDERQAKRAARK